MTPWGLMTLADDVRRGFVKLDASVAEIWDHCAGCGACTAHCKHDNPVHEAVQKLRVQTASMRTGNPQLEHELAQLGLTTSFEMWPAEGDCLILPGQLELEELREWAGVLECLDIDNAYTNEFFWHSGGRFLQAGRADLFAEHVRHVTTQAVGCQSIVCLDPDDYRTLMSPTYDSLRESVSVLFVLSLVEDQMEQIAAVTEAPMVPVHPCRLFAEPRWLGIVSDILSRLTTGAVEETLLNADRAACCGAGDGFAARYPELGARMGEDLFEDVESSHIVALGGCSRHLRNSLHKRQVSRLSSLLLASLGMEESA